MKFKLVENIDGGHENVSFNKTLNEVYHFTSLEKFVSILKSDTFKCGYWNNLSTTTTKDIPYFTDNVFNVLIVLDYNKLKQEFESQLYTTDVGDDAVDWENEIRFNIPKQIDNFSNYMKGVIIHKKLESDSLLPFILHKIGFETYDDLFDFIKSKISTVRIEDIKSK